MIINYNVSGSDRKQLVAAIAEHTGEKAKYLGAPGFAYQIGGFTVSVDGKVTIEDNSADDANEDVEADEACGICISMPRSLFTESNLENLKALIAAKGNLIKKALGVDDLPIEVTDEKVSFPWFPAVPTPEELKAYDTFICKLCEMARNAKRVVAKEKETDNDKYAFRCFLLRLGFIGAEFKTERKILLCNLAGSSAFKSGQPKEVEVCE